MEVILLTSLLLLILVQCVDCEGKLNDSEQQNENFEGHKSIILQ